MRKSKRSVPKTRSKLSSRKLDTDAQSELWWKKRRQDIIAELSKDLSLIQTIFVLPGRSAAPGAYTIELYHNDFPMPLAIIWFGLAGLNQIQINNMYTFEPACGCGLMKFLQSTLQGYYPRRKLITCVGTKSGRGFMLATGWRATDVGYELDALQDDDSIKKL